MRRPGAPAVPLVGLVVTAAILSAAARDLNPSLIALPQTRPHGGAVAMGSVSQAHAGDVHLPLPDCLTALDSDKGQEMLSEALQGNGITGPFLPLIEELITQETESSCGLYSLLTVLNAFGMDPGRKWAPDVPDWDWYGDATMLNGITRDGSCAGSETCCLAQEDVDMMGMCLSQWPCLARANGLDAQEYLSGNFSSEDFRSSLRRMDRSRMVVINFHRRALQQVGSGHFSPVGAYHEPSDSVLILDVARFKYVPFWAPVEMIMDAMSDSYVLPKPDGSLRGYVDVTRLPDGPQFPGKEPDCL